MKVVVSYNDESHEYVYNGQFSVEIPNGKEYRISFGEVNGYKTPSSVTYTAVKGFSRSVEVTYSSEFLTLNVTGTSTPVVTIKKAKEVGVSEKYKVVDYVETNGTQYIDTGFKPNQNTRVVVDFHANDVAKHVWGSRIEWRNNSFLCCWENNFDWCVQINAANFNGGSFDVKSRHTVEMSCTEFKVDGTTTATYSVDAFQCTNNLLIASVQNSEQNENFVGKYYSLKVYDGNNLIRDYVPVKNSQGVYGLYDKINDTFSSSTGSLAGGGYIYYETIATQISVSGLHKIAYDTEYMIEASAVDGFTTPEVQYYTANQPSRSVSVDYLLAEERVTVNVFAEGGASVDGQAVIVETGVPSEGVYIEDTSYKLWTVDEWDNSATANSIVVSDGSTAKRVSLANGSKGVLGYFTGISTLPAIGTQEEAELDMNGKENTSLLKEIHMSTTIGYKDDYELYYAPYNFPDGSIKGYVPSLGELIFLYEYNSEINSALEKCGAEAIKHSNGAYEYRMFSSTVRTSPTTGSNARMWTMDWDDGSIDYYYSGGDTMGLCIIRYMADYFMLYPITNGKASFSVPYDENYTVSLSDMDGYTTPESQTYTASQPTREISMEYKKAGEHVIVNVVDETNAFVNGQTLTVSGGVTGSYTINNSKVEFDVPEGLTYTVSVNYKDGYKTPGSQTFTAGTGTREIDMVYKEVKLGVFIQGVSGKLYETDAWTSQETPNGVAVITEECSFVIALTGSSSLTSSSALIQIHSSRSGALENYMTAISTQAQAQADYDGATNTTNIMKLQSSTTYAAGWCNAFSFPSGKKGFLPSLGQMRAAYNNKAAVDAALTKAGGTAFNSTSYWTSTFYGIINGSYRSCWRLNWSKGNMDYYYINGSYLVRAFSDL